MKRLFIIQALLIAFATCVVSAQEINKNSIRIIVRNEETKMPVAGATVSVKETEIRAVTDSDGIALLMNISDGDRVIEVFSAGFETRELRVSFPRTETVDVTVYIEVSFEAGEVVIKTTRTGREIEDTPTRVEAIDEEEVDEKSSMRSSNASMILNESTGIKVQQTSATSYTQSIRIQGLDGRYTQILKDGFPAFGGFSGSQSILDIPPLDLKQIEIIKGASSTFYGQGAIAGVVNFISKEPEEQPVTSMIFNQTSALGTDLSIFSTRRFDRFAYSALGTVNYQREYDADGDSFTELPLTRSFNFNPRIFGYFDDKTRLMIGNSSTFQYRMGGDVNVIRDRADDLHQYFEKNESMRNITTVQFDRDFADGGRMTAKQSLAFFNREIRVPEYRFEGRQFNSFTDVSYFRPLGKHTIVVGFNAVYDRFRETRPDTVASAPRDESRSTVGGFVQDSFDITDRLSLEAGLRIDRVAGYGLFVLPRASVLYRFSEKISSRASFGLGYKTPSIFTEDAETLLFRNVLPIGNALRAERSRGGTIDVNFKDEVGEKFSYSINQMFFVTEIEDPLVLDRNATGFYVFSNAARPVRTFGLETNVRLSYDIVKFFAGYTYLNAKAKYLEGNQRLPLTPGGKLNSALLIERHEDFKIGFEAYYTASQYLSDRSKTRAYWVAGIFGEKSFGRFSLFINAENITDTRQSRFGAVVIPPYQNPTFAEIYTHTEGRIFNGGIKIRL